MRGDFKDLFCGCFADWNKTVRISNDVLKFAYKLLRTSNNKSLFDYLMILPIDSNERFRLIQTTIYEVCCRDHHFMLAKHIFLEFIKYNLKINMLIKVSLDVIFDNLDYVMLAEYLYWCRDLCNDCDYFALLYQVLDTTPKYFKHPNMPAIGYKYLELQNNQNIPMYTMRLWAKTAIRFPCDIETKWILESLSKCVFANVATWKLNCNVNQIATKFGINSQIIQHLLYNPQIFETKHHGLFHKAVQYCGSHLENSCDALYDYIETADIIIKPNLAEEMLVRVLRIPRRGRLLRALLRHACFCSLDTPLLWNIIRDSKTDKTYLVYFLETRCTISTKAALSILRPQWDKLTDDGAVLRNLVIVLKFTNEETKKACIEAIVQLAITGDAAQTKIHCELVKLALTDTSFSELVNDCIKSIIQHPSAMTWKYSFKNLSLVYILKYISSQNPISDDITYFYGKLALKCGLDIYAVRIFQDIAKLHGYILDDMVDSFLNDAIYFKRKNVVCFIFENCNITVASQLAYIDTVKTHGMYELADKLDMLMNETVRIENMCLPLITICA